MVYELDDSLAHLNDLDVTWRFDMDAVLQERAQQAPAAGDADDGTAEMMDSSQGGAVDASSARAERDETAETMGSSQGGAVAPRSREGGPEATRAHQQPPAPTKVAANFPPQSCRRGQHTNSAAGDGSPRQ